MMLALGASSSALAQHGFSATPATIAMVEGGNDSILTVETDGERFSFSIPIAYGSQVRADTRTVTFTSDVGASIINVQFSTNYPGGLPQKDKLRDQVAAKHPGASLVAAWGFGPATSFDLFRPAGNGLMLRIRDAYVAYPEGNVELTFTCNSADFDKQKLAFMRLLNSFRLLPKDDK